MITKCAALRTLQKLHAHISPRPMTPRTLAHTHMKTNTATVQRAAVSRVESLTLAHKQASVQPGSPSPQTLGCLNLAVTLISSLSTPPGLADAQLTAAFIGTHRAGIQLLRPLRSQLRRRGISVETAQRRKQTIPHPKSDSAVGKAASDTC